MNRSCFKTAIVQRSRFRGRRSLRAFTIAGSGKTRLMQAAARYASVQKSLDILNCCVLDLMQEIVDAIKMGTWHAFRKSLMRLDALFIDNIWLLQNRRQAARMVFPLFDAFAGKGGLVMIASDLSPLLLSEWSLRKTLKSKT